MQPTASIWCIYMWNNICCWLQALWPWERWRLYVCIGGEAGDMLSQVQVRWGNVKRLHRVCITVRQVFTTLESYQSYIYLNLRHIRETTEIFHQHYRINLNLTCVHAHGYKHNNRFNPYVEQLCNLAFWQVVFLSVLMQLPHSNEK